MRDRWVVALALAAVAGALRPSPLPVAVGTLLGIAAYAASRPALLCLAAALLASALAQRALDGLDDVAAGPVTAVVTLASDPEPALGGLRADAILHGRHVELQVRGPAEAVVADRLAGERLVVRGDLQPLARRPWLVVRHVGARLVVHRAERGPPAEPVPALANAVRRTLVSGAAPLTPAHRTLYTGLVIGDDRAQSPALTDDFRGAGLTHLLAVSGQNVAFLLTLAAPVGRRLRLWPRLVLSLALVGGFVVLTRAEPSVARAGVMAALSVTTLTIGRPVSRLRVLALGVTLLVLVDPLLVESLGFRLSAGAALAIVTLAEPLASVLPGPRWLAEPLAVTVAAQIGVAPFLVTTFGPIPLASLPANLLAVPAAGLVMVWGMSAGLVAGVVGHRGAAVVHLPTRVLLDWIEEVAARAAAAPLGELDGRGVLAAALGLALLVAASRHGRGAGRSVGAVLVAGALFVAVVGAQAPAALRTALQPGLVRWHAGGTDVVVLGGAGWRAGLDPGAVLEGLRRAGVEAVDLLVLADDDVPASLVDLVTGRHPTAAVLSPDAVPREGTAIDVGRLHVVLVPGDERLVVEARPTSR